MTTFDGRPPDLGAMCDRLTEIAVARPRTRTVASVEGDVDATYRNLLQALESSNQPADSRPSANRGGAEQHG